MGGRVIYNTDCSNAKDATRQWADPREEQAAVPGDLREGEEGCGGVSISGVSGVPRGQLIESAPGPLITTESQVCGKSD